MPCFNENPVIPGNGAEIVWRQTLTCRVPPPDDGLLRPSIEIQIPVSVALSSAPCRLQRFDAARLAISDRCAGESMAALAFPPFNPPIRPRATASGSFGRLIGAGAIAKQSPSSDAEGSFLAAMSMTIGGLCRKTARAR